MVLELTTHHWLPWQRPKVASEFVEINIRSEGRSRRASPTLPRLRNTYELNVSPTCAEAARLGAGTCTNEANAPANAPRHIPTRAS